MRIHSILTGGTVVGAIAFVGMFLWPASESRALDNPATITLTGTIRDFLPDANHPDFSLSGSAGHGPYCANVSVNLDTDNKPLFTGTGWRVSQHWRDYDSQQISWCHYTESVDGNGGKGKAGSLGTGAIQSQQTFSQWYRDTPGTNLSRLWTITLTWGNDATFGPCYMYDTNNFNPIDNQLMGNDFDEKNFFFTYEIVATFTYDADGGQKLWYKGDDDCWVFVNGRMLMDHGGITGSREQTVHINNDRPGLEGLVDGQEYQLRFFLAERKQPQSQFHLKTNFLLNTNQASDAVLAAYD